MLTVASVLRSGGRYGVDDVRKLYGMVRRNLSHFDRFVCLSDVAFEIEGVERVPLIDRFPGWWSKVELFTLTDDRVFYADLDTVILGSIDELTARTEGAIGLRDFYFPHRFASGLMLWSPATLGRIYTDFIVNAKKIMAECRRGDQEFIERYIEKPAYWQDVLPGKVLSFKAHLNGGLLPPPSTASVIAFHGVPRPSEVSGLPWVKEHWAA